MVAPRDAGRRPREDRDAGLHRVVLDDLRRTPLSRTLRQELRDLHRFYLNDEQRARLESMGAVRRFFREAGWLFRNLLLSLTPARRLLVLLSLLLLVLDLEYTVGSLHLRLNTGPWGVLILLVVLMLELKDKLLARDEIEVAREVQLSLLPSTHPRIPGWTVWSVSKPANDVGGDLVDYLDHPSGRTGIALGDVAGKGMGAALLGAKLQATLRALVPICGDLEELGGRLNGVLNLEGLENRFATLFYLELAPGSGSVRFLNAGHNPALVVRPDRIERLAASSYPLGMLPGAEYAQGNVELAPGDLLVVYSDGLTEARGANDEEFGEIRLEGIVSGQATRSPEAVGGSLVAAAERFLGEERLHDDLSLVVIRRDPSGEDSHR